MGSRQRAPRRRPLSPDAAGVRAKVRVLVVDDHALFAESLELALSLEGYDVHRAIFPEDGSRSTLISEVLRVRPFIALVDLDLGVYGSGARLISPLVSAGAHVVVVTGWSDEVRWGECLRDGARAVLVKSQPLSDILSTVRRITDGVPVLDHEERARLIAVWRSQSRELAELDEHLRSLTPRESAVLAELMRGRTVRDIAAASVVSEATVRTQVKSILAKLQVSSQIAAVGLAHKAGWEAST